MAETTIEPTQNAAINALFPAHSEVNIHKMSQDGNDRSRYCGMADPTIKSAKNAAITAPLPVPR